MLKNPFSFYDFLGYLFPGLVCVIFMKVIYSMDSPVTIKTILDHGLVATFSWKDTVLSFKSDQFVFAHCWKTQTIEECSFGR